MLAPFIEDASIRLKSGERVSINEEQATPVQIYCGLEDVACAGVELIDEFSSDRLTLRGEFARPEEISPVVTLENRTTGHLFGEVVETRESIIKDAVNKIKTVNTEDRAKLLSTFEEGDFQAFLEQSHDLAQLQSIQYLFTRRINNLRKENKQQTPRRPVIEQRKVGEFLYKLQATQKGDSYWYLQFTRDGKRVHKYLGKERPTFNPQEDLGRLESRKTLAAHS
jgi:hypothetical protein